ncbi:MAG: MotA/TolQ/ExbB proton channel family protein [Planctomycetaceae bacterium]|nr:MotA/TolQ/ExbB proton channel family protein [Planctomycetaceae bacterium]
MSVTASSHSPGTGIHRKSGGGLQQIVSSPILWGAAITWCFYALIPFAPVRRELIERYFCSHPLEYAQAALFFVGAAILFAKGLQLLTEKQAVSLPLPTLPEPLQTSSCTASIRHALGQLPRRLRKSAFSRRLEDLADYLQHRRDGEGLEAHAQHLAEAAADRQHDSYSQLQTIIWAVPILGFLGTVMGITLAIANVTPEQLDTSLNSVTGGLAVAFDTTTVALSQSILMVFASFFVKRQEQQILGEVDERVFKGLVSPLAGGTRNASPLVDAESRAARELLSRTEALIQTQTGLWQESVEGLRSRWVETLDAQQQELSTALAGGVEASMSDHAGLLHKLREEFLTAYREMSGETARQLAESRTQHATEQEQLRLAWQETWGEIHAEMQRDRDERSRASAAMLDGFSTHVQAAIQQLCESTAAMQSQLGAVSRQTDLLAQIVGQEEHLAGLQQRLTDNLQALQAAETMEQTLHSLNAAIHLLTARTRPVAA